MARETLRLRLGLPAIRELRKDDTNHSELRHLTFSARDRMEREHRHACACGGGPAAVEAASKQEDETSTRGSNRWASGEATAERPPSASSSPRVLLGRLHGVWQQRREDWGPADTQKSPTPELRSKQSTPRQSSLIAAAASMTGSAANGAFAAGAVASSSTTASSSCTSGRESRLSSNCTSGRESRLSDFSCCSGEDTTGLGREQLLEPRPLLVAWTRLRTRDLDPLPDSEKLLGIGPASFVGHGLLWSGSFQRYAVGLLPGMTKSSVCLGVAELGRLLREHRIALDYGARCRIIELAAGQGAQNIDFRAFAKLVEATAQSATEAQERQPHARRCRSKARQPEEVALAVVRAVFNSYDFSRNCELAREDCMRLLRDRGQVPRTLQESKDLSHQLAFCREDGLPGPLSFPEFMRFLVFLSGECPSLPD
eukprot:TRINITY_DN22518_c0_g1_i1.p1 TRINITY_DN22518_c0_g1~~TRINITY_DN22518_c0_g1_i1.p1  ORF type:complete len:438 (-),score=78.13 TRINITY_DN22518_c0_g1_i1:33-1313(-)